MTVTKSGPLFLLLAMILVCLSGSACARAGRIEDFNAGWRFHLGPCENGAAVGCDDAEWRPVHLPHDWAIAGPFDPKLGGSTGMLPWRGEGWYRKTFRLDASDGGKRVYLDFDGVMAFPKVYVNGQSAGEWDYGYMSFRVDATPWVKFGQVNLVAVHADTRKHGSRWYPGAGIYRKVRLVLCDPVHVAHWATYVTTPKVTDASASVRVRTRVDNHLARAADVTVETHLVDPDGRTVAQGRADHSVGAGASLRLDQTLNVPRPQRWDVQSPRLYTARVQVERGGKVCDTHETAFGIRTIQWTADDGFHLNGRRVQLKGVDLHHGHGPLGAALFRRAMQRQLQIMKDMGANAVRTSHNPPAPDLLRLCDRLGLVVFDECFDKWNGTADLLDGGQFRPFMQRQVRNFVCRDRNHPCVVVWSIGNEIRSIEANRRGDAPEKVAFMVREFKRHDPSRPVTFGCMVPGAVRGNTHVLDALDITSWNYDRKYLRARERYPDKPIIYSESASAFSTRGYYKLPHPKSKTDYAGTLQLTSYDYTAARWADIPDVEFRRMEQDRYVAGEFVWTGFDYMGEPTPFTQKARSSYFGIVDLCGIPKDRYWLYRSYWRPDVTTIHILPHWNWPDRVGKTVPVYVYTNGDSAELFLNGRSLGRRAKVTEQPEPRTIQGDLPKYYRVIDRYRLRWEDVTYEPGELKVVAQKGGKRIGQAVMRSADVAARIRLTPERTDVVADGQDLAYVLVEAVDSRGTVCPRDDRTVRFAIEGPAEIAGIGNGNPLGLDPFQDDRHPLFAGKAMLILRSVAGQSGTVRVTAAADGVNAGQTKIRARHAE